MRPLGIAIWLVTSKGKVLLQQKKFGKPSIDIFQPIESWVGTNQRTEEKIRQLLEEEFGKTFVVQYSFRQLSKIDKKSFPILGQGIAIRYHFLCPITDQQLAIVFSFGNLKLVGKENLPKIKKLTDRQKDSKEDIVLFKENWEILLGILSK